MLIELKDGRVYMLARTETGRLYESYSHDGGVNWEPLRPSRFLGTDAPAAFLRLPDERILLFWNGCEKPGRVGKDGVYGGRDIVHAAISDDECQTWRGFREVYRDPTRNDTPPRTGDRGMAYPMPYLAPNGKVIVMTGQGRAGATFTFDPDWLLETEAQDAFENGLEDWSVFKPFGPRGAWWRDHVQGAVSWWITRSVTARRRFDPASGRKGWRWRGLELPDGRRGQWRAPETPRGLWRGADCADGSLF